MLPDGQYQLLPVALSLTSGDDRHIRQIAAPGAVADGSRHGNQLTVLIAKPAEGALAERLLQLLNITLIQPASAMIVRTRCQSTRTIASLPSITIMTLSPVVSRKQDLACRGRICQMESRTEAVGTGWKGQKKTAI